MADRKSLSMIGLMMVAATAFVLMAGAVVVADHLNGNLQFDDESAVTFSANQR